MLFDYAAGCHLRKFDDEFCVASCRRIAELVAASSDHEPVRGAAVSRALDRIIRVGDGMHTCLVSKADVELRLVCHSRGRLDYVLPVPRFADK